MSSFRTIALVLAMVVISAAGGCASPQVVPTTGPHPATDPAAVVIYEKEPAKYEVLGMVEVPVGGTVRWDENGDATPGFQRLQAEAAARGANGILLKRGIPDTVLVLAGNKGVNYQVPLRVGKPSVAMAEAIWVVTK